MKKIINILLILLFLTSCSEKPNKDSDFIIETYPVDMSVYSGVENDGTFVGTTVYELQRCLSEKGSGIFYLGYRSCHYCQAILTYPYQVAKDLGVIIYYIDAYSTDYPFITGGGMDLYKELLKDYLRYEDDKAVVYTPHIFTVINGEIKGSIISVNSNWDVTSLTSQQINTIKDEYNKIFSPFVDYFK